MRVSPKSTRILELIAEGRSYDQILARSPDWTYHDIFAAAREALEVVRVTETAGPNGAAARSAAASPVSRSPLPSEDGWTPADDTRLIQLVEAGKSLAAIATQLQRPPSEVKNRLRTLTDGQNLHALELPPSLPTTKELDLHIPARQGQRWEAEEHQLFIELYESGLSDAEIAEHLQRSVGSITSRVDKLRNDQAGKARSLGKHPRDGQPIELLTGRFGPYIKHGENTLTIPRQIHPGKMVLQQAIELLDSVSERG
jgi:DNA-binding NarL/FixJ family response regulator